MRDTRQLPLFRTQHKSRFGIRARVVQKRPSSSLDAVKDFTGSASIAVYSGSTNKYATIFSISAGLNRYGGMMLPGESA